MDRFHLAYHLEKSSSFSATDKKFLSKADATRCHAPISSPSSAIEMPRALGECYALGAGNNHRWLAGEARAISQESNGCHAISPLDLLFPLMQRRSNDVFTREQEMRRRP